MLRYLLLALVLPLAACIPLARRTYEEWEVAHVTNGPFLMSRKRVREHLVDKVPSVGTYVFYTEHLEKPRWEEAGSRINGWATVTEDGQVRMLELPKGRLEGAGERVFVFGKEVAWLDLSVGKVQSVKSSCMEPTFFVSHDGRYLACSPDLFQTAVLDTTQRKWLSIDGSTVGFAGNLLLVRPKEKLAVYKGETLISELDCPGLCQVRSEGSLALFQATNSGKRHLRTIDVETGAVKQEDWLLGEWEIYGLTRGQILAGKHDAKAGICQLFLWPLVEKQAQKPLLTFSCHRLPDVTLLTDSVAWVEHEFSGLVELDSGVTYKLDPPPALRPSVACAAQRCLVLDRSSQIQAYTLDARSLSDRRPWPEVTRFTSVRTVGNKLLLEPPEPCGKLGLAAPHGPVQELALPMHCR